MCLPCSDGPTDTSPPDASILCSRGGGALDPLPPGTGLGSGSAPHHRLRHGHLRSPHSRTVLPNPRRTPNADKAACLRLTASSPVSPQAERSQRKITLTKTLRTTAQTSNLYFLPLQPPKKKQWHVNFCAGHHHPILRYGVLWPPALPKHMGFSQVCITVILLREK